MTWNGESYRHIMAVKGIRTSIKLKSLGYKNQNYIKIFENENLPKKIYHGTKKHIAEMIIKNGFKFIEYGDAQLGFGIYFKLNPKEAYEYGNTIIEVTLPEHYEWEEGEPLMLYNTFINSIHRGYNSYENPKYYNKFYNNGDLNYEIIKKEYKKYIKENTFGNNIVVGDFELMIPKNLNGINFLKSVEKTAKIYR